MALLTYVLLALGLCTPASAVPLTWRDDPSSGFDFSIASRSVNGNTVTFSNLQAVNFTTQALPDLAVIVPWVFPVFGGGTTTYSMAWSNADNGWLNNHVGGTSLLITLDNIAGRLSFGSVADGTGMAPLDPTQTLNNVSETRLPGDLIPFLDLGAFAANQSTTFDLVFTYHFRDGRALPADTTTFFFLNTVSPVPEPPILALLGIALLALCLSRSSGKSPKQIS
jgi:hypothetical protein